MLKSKQLVNTTSEHETHFNNSITLPVRYRDECADEQCDA